MISLHNINISFFITKHLGLDMKQVRSVRMDWKINQTPRSHYARLTHKFLAFPAFLQPLGSDYVLNYRYCSEELHRSCHFVGNQMSALLSAVGYFTSKIIQFLRRRKRQRMKTCRGGRAKQRESSKPNRVWDEQYILSHSRMVQTKWTILNHFPSASRAGAENARRYAAKWWTCTWWLVLP